MEHGAVEQPDPVMLIDDCWNRIGTRGDQSCPALAEYSRCLNCPVFERAAARLLDRPLGDAELAEAAQAPRPERAGEPSAAYPEALAHSRGVGDVANGSGESAATHSALVFRVADEWLALPTAALRQIDDLRPIHSLPHRRNRVVLGLVNIRGALTVAVSLGELLRLDRGAGGKPASRNGYPRMLVAAHRGEPVAFPVDEVDGMLRFAAHALMPVPATLAHAGATHASGVLAWHDITVGLLDTDRVFDSLLRSVR